MNKKTFLATIVAIKPQNENHTIESNIVKLFNY